MAKKKSSSQRRLTVFIDSGANINSCKKDVLAVEELGLDSWEEWDRMPEKDKYDLVSDFWSSRGCPEIYWED